MSKSTNFQSGNIVAGVTVEGTTNHWTLDCGTAQ